MLYVFTILFYEHLCSWVVLMYERVVGGRGKGPTLKELSLSAVLIVTIL